MATQTIEFQAPTGLTLTVKLFTPGSDTEIDSQSATERTNDKGTYRASYTDRTGLVRWNALSSSTPVAKGLVILGASTATYYPLTRADVVAISGDETAADNLESYTDGTTRPR